MGGRRQAAAAAGDRLLPAWGNGGRSGCGGEALTGDGNPTTSARPGRSALARATSSQPERGAGGRLQLNMRNSGTAPEAGGTAGEGFVNPLYDGSARAADATLPLPNCVKTGDEVVRVGQAPSSSRIARGGDADDAAELPTTTSPDRGEAPANAGRSLRSNADDSVPRCRICLECVPRWLLVGYRAHGTRAFTCTDFSFRDADLLRVTRTAPPDVAQPSRIASSCQGSVSAHGGSADMPM